VFEKNKQDKKRFVIELTEENERKLLEILEDIEKILSKNTPPKPKFESKCRKCAYYEYCFL
jgi:CRISPR-associated exonuclease Cas4